MNDSSKYRSEQIVNELVNEWMKSIFVSCQKTKKWHKQTLL